MIDLKLIREQPDTVKKNLARKGVPPSLVDSVLAFDTKRRNLLQQVEPLKAEANRASEAFAKGKRTGGAADQQIQELKTLSQKIGSIDKEVGDIDKLLADNLIIIPNIPDNGIPDGQGFKASKVVKTWGKPEPKGFKPKDHLKVAEKLGWVSFERGSKVAGSAFAVFQGKGARLVRALINFMMDLHTKAHGYEEVWPPALVNRASMTGTGQLPKMEADMYALKDDDYFLIPTAEVPVTNLLRNEVLKEEDLPVKYAAYTPCFRREAGSYGKDTKGLSRVHQFDKVELVKFVKPERSADELELLVQDAEAVLQGLEIPYRVVLLPAGDLSFAAAKCYDLEAYAPGMDRWFEVSSCSAFFDFQARRMNIKYKPSGGGKAQFVHTLNGSGVAFARTIACLLENHQQPDGSVKFPKALEPYLA